MSCSLTFTSFAVCTVCTYTPKRPHLLPEQDQRLMLDSEDRVLSRTDSGGDDEEEEV